MRSTNNKLHCDLCSCTVSCNKHFLVESHRNTSKQQNVLGSRSELLIQHTSQSFLKRDNTNFVEKITMKFLSADIPLYKLNNKHIKNLFHQISHSLPCETSCRNLVLQLSVNELQRTRNAVNAKQIFWVLMKGLYLACNI